MQKLFLLIFLWFPLLTIGQLNNHWSQNFNDESSLLSGAVVGGGAGPSAIFYNPATISEIKESKISLNASLFSFEFLKVKNALGDGIDIADKRAYATPRFLSYMFKPKKHPNWSIELAFLNRANLSTQISSYVDQRIDILPRYDGNEVYTSFTNFSNRYRDDWVGMGGSVKMNDNLYFGGSVFISFLSQYSSYTLQIDARPGADYTTSENQTYDIASYKEEELVKFNDYRLFSKIGMFYSQEHFSFGLNITPPVLSGIYSDGKNVMRQRSQNNITDPETGVPKPNYLVQDYAEKKEVRIKSKTPISVSAGFTLYNKSKTKILYTTLEYFGEVRPYAIAKASSSLEVDNDLDLELDEYNQWLNFVEGAKPVLNAAIGYKWYVKENFMLLTGFRTDFSYRKDYDLKPFWPNFSLKNFNFNKYHFTGGSTLHIFGQDITAGIQYTLGTLKNQNQIVNLSEPVEYNQTEKKALQGTRQNSMNTVYNSISLYLAASFNFGSEKND